VSSALPTVSSGFAKLLATENISVHIDSTASTACFDVESRVLTMPVWEKMSEQLTDMLVGHEVSHALHTIDDDLLGTIRKLSEDAGVPLAIAMAGLNVVEDVRIDKLIQRRYPGLRNDYATGYPEMREMNLFEIKADENLADRPFLDRLNLHAKAYNGEIAFSPEEQILVDRAENTETYEEVLELTKIILQLVAQQHDENQQKQSVSEGEADETNNDMPSDETGESIGENGTESEGEESEDGVDTEGDGTMESAETAEDDGSTAEGEEGEDVPSNGDQDGGGQGWDEQMPQSADAMETALRDLALNEDSREHYNTPSHATITAPSGLSRYAVLPIEESRKILTKGLNHLRMEEAATTIGELRATANMMALAFERKQAAHVDQRTQIAKSGDLDMNQLHNYKLTDDLFLRNEVKPNGKNHAITVVIDWSASMSGKCISTVRQAATFAMFCQKVGVPCEVFIFQSGSGVEFSPFEDGQIKDGVRNIKLLDTRVRRNLFLMDVQRMLALGTTTDRHGRVHGFGMGCTPLGQSVAITKFTHGDLMRKTQAEIGTIIFLTDGEGDAGLEYNTHGTQTTSIVDPISRRTTVSGGRYGQRSIYDWVRAETGAKIINFFMVSKREGKNILEYRSEPEKREDNMTTWKNESWGEVSEKSATRDGWDAAFVVFDKAADDSAAEQDALDLLSDDAGKAKVRNAFIKAAKSKVASRPLVERITAMIAC